MPTALRVLTKDSAGYPYSWLALKGSEEAWGFFTTPQISKTTNRSDKR